VDRRARGGEANDCKGGLVAQSLVFLAVVASRAAPCYSICGERVLGAVHVDLLKLLLVRRVAPARSANKGTSSRIVR